MDVYKQIIEPTRVNTSVVCHFMDAKRPNLVVSKGTVLQVFSITLENKLLLVAHYKLHGVITDIKPIKSIESSTLEYLIVATKFAKLSIIKWNFEINSIETVSLHYYENFFENNSSVKSLSNARLVTDSNNGCACMIFDDLLAFLPLKKDSENESSRNKKLKSDEDFDMEEDDDEDDEDEDDDDDSNLIYKPTFIVPANKLDTSISEIISCEFLHNYREPTLAILFAPRQTWAGNLKKVQDNVNLVVLSLDLRKKTSTTIISLSNLPYDLYAIKPLKSPLNGCLLVGCNELLHVDSSGSSQGVITNKYTSDITRYRNFTNDQNDLDLNLENCVIHELSRTPKRLMLISEEGVLYWIDFRVEGRLIRSFHLVKVPENTYKDILLSHASSVNDINEELLFVGSSDGNSLVIKWESGSRVIVKKTKERKTVDDDDDDIDYSDEEKEEEEEEEEETISDDTLSFKVVDQLINCGPITNLTLAPLSTEKFSGGLSNPNYNEISVVAATGNGRSGAVTAFSPSIKPNVKSTLKFTDVNRIWTLANKAVFVTSKGVRLEKNYNYLITTNTTEGKSDCFSINDNFKNVSLKTGFQNNELIVNIGFINNKNNILQVTRKNCHLYDLNFKLIKTLSISDIQEKPTEIDINGEADTAEEDEEFVYSHIYGNYALITTSKGGVNIVEFLSGVLSGKKSTDYFTKVSIPSILSDVLITTGTITSSRLYGTVSNVQSIIDNILKKRSNKETLSVSGKQLEDQEKDVLFVLATGDNRIVLFQKNHRQKVFQLDNVDKLSEVLSINFFNINDAYPDPFIKQVMLVSLGDQHAEKEYLTVLTIGGETYFYELFFDQINNICKFKKVEDTMVTGAPDNAFPWGTKIERRLIYIDDFRNGLKCLFITGIIPYFVIKQAHSVPRIYKFSKFPAISFASFKSNDSKSFSNDEGSNFIFVDNLKNARICSIPYNSTTDYSNLLPVTKIPIGESIKAIAYHEGSKMFILSTFQSIEYNCIDEEGLKIAGSEDKPHAQSFKGSLKLLSPKTWTVIDEIALQDNEVALTVKAMFLNTSSASDMFAAVNVNKRKKELVLVGTGKLRMEDLGANGSFHLFDIIDIIPEIGKPEFNHKFKEIFKEDTKGAVTALTELSGRFLVSQGQKVLVRDLQEDNTVVPVAFLDTSIYVTEAKSFGNLLILGDIMKSIWFAGFDAEPYRMIMISKDVIPVDVNAADFISYGGDIFFLIGDNSENIHLLQYDPEDPASLSGQRLVRKTTFNTNSTTTCMRSFPKRANNNTEFQIVGGNIDGSLYMVSPISEDSYRRMYVLQQQIIDKELHHLGLNPRMNRISPSYEYINSNFTSSSTQQAKAIIDFEVLRTFTKLNNDRKKQLGLKVGRYAYTEVWKDLVEHNLNII